MLPYILKICGFKNSSVYKFYSMYQKYTLFVKLYICGLTYRLYVRYKHKLCIDVITYVPTLAMTLPLLLSTILSHPSGIAIIVAVPVPGIGRFTAPVRSCFGGGSQGSQGSPVGFVGWNPSRSLLLGSAVVRRSRVTTALGRPQKVHRKVPGRSGD